MAFGLDLARKTLLEAVASLTTERIPLAECWKRILAQSVFSSSDFPPFDRSPLDGYAVLVNEIQGASSDKPVLLREIEIVQAGAVPLETVVPGTASRIMTGAPIPKGATGVVRLEDTVTKGKDIQILSGLGAEKNICRQGEEITLGEEVIQPGTVINAGVMGLLAALGMAKPLVYRRPRVALIATGNELIDIDQPLVAGKIRNSNSYMLTAQAAECGADVVMTATAGDSVEEIRNVIRTVPDCEILVTTGGASVGDYDLIENVFSSLDVAIFFDRVGIKPGMPVIAGTNAGRLYIGLSGNPAAASIAFEQLVRPVLLKLGGYREWQRTRILAYLAEPYRKPSMAKRFVWARWWQENGKLFAVPIYLQGNGMLKSSIHANALIVIPENSPPLAAGSLVELELF